MAQNTINTLYGANVYIDGDNYAGQAEEVTLPDLKPKETEHKPVSNFGSFDLPTGLDKMTMKIKWNQVTADIMGGAADFYTASDIIVRGNIDNWTSGSRTGSFPLTAFIKGRSKNVPAIGMKHQDNPDVETEYSVTMYKLEIDGKVIFHVDYFAQIYIVNGVDVMADYRANLGL